MVEPPAGARVGDVFSFEAGEADTAGVGAPFCGKFMTAPDTNR